ncbi:hypothetical protein Nwi_2439 [Nitrobacter winogradskyi Nb-255]|uniref:Uncharacterized protein n=2 Tax=Nitrobacter winogradskyi TaxID=913 RepID=Q3SPU9_NITWN|nr:hypothetical protein Nwi_2439 [Nitrobacter winogradskyi Nb-255]
MGAEPASFAPENNPQRVLTRTRIRYAPPMIDPVPPPSASTAFDLYYLQNGKRFFWRNPNHGVSLIDDGHESAILWHNEGKAIRRLWTDIVSINMTAGTTGKEIVNNCRINFRNGRFLVVTDGGASGEVDHDRTPVYRDFVRALHRRLALAPPGAIRFVAGVSQTRHTVMLVTGVIAGLLFIVTPLVLTLFLRDWRALGPLAAGTVFVWPFFKVIGANRPRDYDPRHPPGELMD